MTDQPLAFPLDERPRLRPVEAFPVDHQGRRYMLLRDPADADLDPITLSDGAVDVLRLLDGRRTVAAIEAELQRTGASMANGQVHAFLQQIDAAGYLEGPRARHRLAQRQAAFRSRPVRVAVHAGGSYPDGPMELPRFLAAGYQHRDGPGALPGRRDPTAPILRGAIAPHVDLHRGAPTYSWAYKALAEAQPADLYVVLGTSHVGVQGAFAATLKPYDTPLGAVPTDPAFVDRLGRLWGRDLFEGEFAHASEHSIEFQAVYLRSLGLAGEHAAPMVAILCDSLHSLVLPPYSPRDVAIVADFVAALREAVAEDGRPVTFVAAVDLAHVGRRFGDSWLVDVPRQAQLREADLEMLRYVAEPDPEGYYRQVMRDNDARRICGFTPIYLLTELMAAEGARGDVLRYHQWVASDASSSVTFASVVFR